MSKFLVARVLNKYRDLDYFHAHDEQYVAAFIMGKIHAHEFETQKNAELCAEMLRILLPKWCGTNAEIEYIVIPA